MREAAPMLFKMTPFGEKIAGLVQVDHRFFWLLHPKVDTGSIVMSFPFFGIISAGSWHIFNRSSLLSVSVTAYMS